MSIDFDEVRSRYEQWDMEEHHCVGFSQLACLRRVLILATPNAAEVFRTVRSERTLDGRYGCYIIHQHMKLF